MPTWYLSTLRTDDASSLQTASCGRGLRGPFFSFFVSEDLARVSALDVTLGFKPALTKAPTPTGDPYAGIHGIFSIPFPWARVTSQTHHPLRPLEATR